MTFRFVVLLSGLMLAAFAAGTADAASFDITFASPNLAGSPGNTVTMSGAMTNNFGFDLLITGAGVNLAGFAPGDIDLTEFILNATGLLKAGASIGPVNFFTVAIPKSFPAGSYAGTLLIQGGTTPNDDSSLASARFSVQVNTVPEPASWVLVLSVLGLLAMRARRWPPVRTVALGVTGASVLAIGSLTAADFSVLHSFGCSPIGAGPYAELSRDSAGNLYGTTTAGGPYCAGVVYKVSPTGQATVLYAFTGGSDGASPKAGVILDDAGNVYGTTPFGGAANAGVLFKVDPAGHLTVLHTFTVGDALGYIPSIGKLVRDSAGNLYGTTTHGGPADRGLVYKLSSAGQQTVLASFMGGSDGSYPEGGLFLDATGDLYGTTLRGGSSDNGTVFKVSSTGQKTVLHSFGGAVDGKTPQTGVVRDTAGNLYGVTPYGGKYGRGVVYRLDAAGGERILYDFTSSEDDGGFDETGVIIGPGGKVYGTSRYGGVNGAGDVYEISAGDKKSLYSFPLRRNFADAHNSGVIWDSDGNLYWTTAGGGAQNVGSVMVLNNAGQGTVLYSFPGAADGSNPVGTLSQDSAGNLYGTTYLGGPWGAGTVFKVSPGGQETVLYSFRGGTDGALPVGVISDSAGNLYGTTWYGGVAGRGVLFKLDPNGRETVLYNFSIDDSPSSGVIRDSAGNLYGTTQGGGIWRTGSVYKIDPIGREWVLYSFTGGVDGLYPAAGVVADSAGNLYGTAPRSGSAGQGVVYKLDTNGQQTVLYNFTGGTDGAYPQAGVILDAAGNLFGTAVSGGNGGAGVVYRIDPSGRYAVLYSFTNGLDGGLPFSPLTRDADGNLYGTTVAGGQFSGGVVFKLTPAGQQTVLHHFAVGANGVPADSGLLRDAAGNLFGTSYSDGSKRSGTVYKISPSPPQIVVTKTLARNPATQQVVVRLVLTNTGETAAANVQLSLARIGATNATVLPGSLGSLESGSSATADIAFPASVGDSGAAAVLTIGGIYTGGSFNSASRVTLP